MIEEKLCEICLSRPARIVVLRRRREDINRTFVCPECANERARAHAKANLDFERLLVRFGRSPAGEAAAHSCGLCGATLADVVVDARPGCCLCYSRFAGEIGRSIDVAQGHHRHIGKAPSR